MPCTAQIPQEIYTPHEQAITALRDIELAKERFVDACRMARDEGRAIWVYTKAIKAIEDNVKPAAVELVFTDFEDDELWR